MLSLRWKLAIGMVLVLWIGLLLVLVAWFDAGRPRGAAGSVVRRIRIDPEMSLRSIMELRYEEGRGGWCRWRYIFVDPDRERLERIVPTLLSDIIRVVAIHGPVQREAGLRYILEAEKVERFRAAEAMFARLDRLTKMARQQGIERFEGIELGVLASGACEQ